MRRRVSLGDLAIAGAIIGAAAALLLSANLDISYEEETGRWIITPKEEANPSPILGKGYGQAKAEASPP